MRAVARVALAGLGLVLAASAARHWLGGDDLVAHYRAVGAGAGGVYLFAALQTAAAGGLLWPRWQVATGAVVAVVMIAAAASRLARGPWGDAWEPVGLLVWAAVPTVYLLAGRSPGR